MARSQPGNIHVCSWLLLPAVALGLFGCTERPSGRDVSQDTSTVSVSVASEQLFLASAKAALPPPGRTLADLPDSGSAGARLLVQYCTACHALPTPSMHSATDWPQVTRRMWLRVDRVARDYDVPNPSTAERLVLLPYLTDHALQVSETNLPARPGREVFTTTCSRCHALPDPKQHSAADWVTVVRRMSQHLEQMLGVTLSREDFSQIVLYLEQVSEGRSP